MREPYHPIDCGLHDGLLALATRGARVVLRYHGTEPGRVLETEDRIADVFSRDGAEWLRTGSGMELRLDRLIRAGELRLAPGHRPRPMEPGDWPEVARILAEGIATGHATFETRVPSWEAWDAGHLAKGRLVVEAGGEGPGPGAEGSVQAGGPPALAGWAALSPVSKRAVYAGVAEVSVYVAAAHRGQGVGRTLLEALVQAAEEGGVWTLQAGIFPENGASLALHADAGFRVVGRRERLGKLGGVWRDVLLLERRSPVVG